MYTFIDYYWGSIGFSLAVVVLGLQLACTKALHKHWFTWKAVLEKAVDLWLKHFCVFVE
jgi:hypothetical protein